MYKDMCSEETILVNQFTIFDTKEEFENWFIKEGKPNKDYVLVEVYCK